MYATFTSTPVFEIAFCQKALGYPLHKPQAFFFLADTGLSLAHFLESQCPRLFTMKFTRTLTDFLPPEYAARVVGVLVRVQQR
jgi:hypothetical protein